MVITSKEIVVPSLVNYAEYLQSSGTQYIDTGFMPNQDTRVVIDAHFQAAGNTHLASVAGVSYYFTLFVSDVGAISSRYGSSNIYAMGGVSWDARRVYDKNKNVLSFDGNTLTSPAETFSMAYNLFLFARNLKGTPDLHCSAKVYSCQIYDNGVLVRDYWPCFDPDGVACMHDKVEKKYHYNAGTGEFVAGGAV